MGHTCSPTHELRRAYQALAETLEKPLHTHVAELDNAATTELHLIGRAQ